MPKKIKEIKGKEFDSGAGGRYFADDCINSLCDGLVPAAPASDAGQRMWLWDTSVALTGLEVNFDEQGVRALDSELEDM